MFGASNAPVVRLLASVAVMQPLAPESTGASSCSIEASAVVVGVVHIQFLGTAGGGRSVPISW